MAKMIVFVSRKLDVALPAADAIGGRVGKMFGRPEFLQVERDKTEGIERNPQLMTRVEPALYLEKPFNNRRKR